MKIDELKNKIICADCIDILRDFPDKSIDIILTDPPYGLNINYGNYQDTKENLLALIKRIMPEFLRVAKRIVITPGVTNICYYPEPDWIMAWISRGGAKRNPWGFSCWQPILCYGKDPYLENSMGARADIIDDNHIPQQYFKNYHPCPKPIEFIKKLLVRCSVKPTDIILDPFCGSGVILQACKELNRTYIGIDINFDYCIISENRIINITPNLF